MSRKPLAPIATARNSKPRSNTCDLATPWWSGASPGWRDPQTDHRDRPRPRAKETSAQVLTRNIDTGTPEGRLFFHITAAFDEFQRELIVENTKAGLVAARKRGRRAGGQRCWTRRESASPSDAQGHGELPVCRGCHRSTQDREDGLLPIFPVRSYPRTPESALTDHLCPCRFTYLCVKEPCMDAFVLVDYIKYNLNRHASQAKGSSPKEAVRRVSALPQLALLKIPD